VLCVVVLVAAYLLYRQHERREQLWPARAVPTPHAASCSTAGVNKTLSSPN